MTYILLFSTLFLSYSAYTQSIEDVFTDAELSRALGDRAGEIRASGLLEPNSTADNQDDEEADVSSAVSAADLIQPARGGTPPIWGPFTAGFRRCAPGCVPANYNVFRRGRHTCHSQGRAIDVGMIICDGQEYPAIRGGRFSQFVSCMKQDLIVLYQERRGRGATRDHYDHAHFSIGCVR